MMAGLLYYCKFLSSLEKKGFTVNPYDPCVWNKDINEKQLTICFHVDDCKISHVDNDKIIAWLRKEYESVFKDGTGKMKVARGKVHKYLGMTLDFTTPKLVKVTFVDEIVESWDKACNELEDGYNTVPVCLLEHSRMGTYVEYPYLEYPHSSRVLMAGLATTRLSPGQD
jgi:hypothetical protein